MVREFREELRKLQAEGGGIEITRSYLYRFPPFSFRIFDVELGEVPEREDPESRTVFPANDGAFKEEALWVDFDPLLGGDVVVEEGIEEAAEEHKDGESPVPGVGAITGETEDDNEEYDVPAHGPVVFRVGWGIPAEDRREFFHKSCNCSIISAYLPLFMCCMNMRIMGN